MSNFELFSTLPYKVADMSQADFGRKEIELAEKEIKRINMIFDAENKANEDLKKRGLIKLTKWYHDYYVHNIVMEEHKLYDFLWLE